MFSFKRVTLSCWVYMYIVIELLILSLLVMVFGLGLYFQPIIYFLTVVILTGLVLPSYGMSSFVSSYAELGLLADEMFFWLGLVTLVVSLLSGFVYKFGPASKPTPILSMFILLIICCIGVFGAFRVFHLYLFYELSLVPIIYIILRGGHYPDRGSRGVAMLAYTAVFSFPFMVFLSLSLLSSGVTSFLP